MLQKCNCDQINGESWLSVCCFELNQARAALRSSTTNTSSHHNGLRESLPVSWVSGTWKFFFGNSWTFPRTTWVVALPWTRCLDLLTSQAHLSKQGIARVGMIWEHLRTEHNPSWRPPLPRTSSTTANRVGKWLHIHISIESRWWWPHPQEHTHCKRTSTTSNS